LCDLSVSVADVVRQYPSRFGFALIDSTSGTDKGTSLKLVGKYQNFAIKISNFCFFLLHSIQIAFDTENEDAFETYIDEKISLIGTSFCWGDKGYIFIGTADDSLIQIFLQFDREKLPFRTTQFTEEERVKAHNSIGMFKKIRLHKMGLFCASSDNNIRLITFENQDNTLQEANNVTDIIELNGDLTTITFNQNYNQLFICSSQGVELIDLVVGQLKHSSLIPISLGKIVDVAVLNPTSDVVLTGRDTGALEAWSIDDGSRKFSTEIIDQTISHIVSNPNFPLVIVTTTSGYFYFYEINRDSFRLVHRLRVHSNDIRSIKFNSRGTLLVSTGLDNSLFLMEIRADQRTVDEMFQIIYRTDLEGEPFALDLDDFDESEQQQETDDESTAISQKEKINQTRIIIALNTKSEKFGRFLIVDFDWPQYRG